MPLKWYSSMKKKIEKGSNEFKHRNLTLKVKFWHFLTAPLLIQNSKFNNFVWLQLILSQKTLLILYPSLENITTGIAIRCKVGHGMASSYILKYAFNVNLLCSYWDGWGSKRVITILKFNNPEIKLKLWW